MPTYTLHLGIFFTCRKATTWDRQLYFPFEGRRAEDFFALKIRRLRPGMNPRTWVPNASTLSLDHRSRFAHKHSACPTKVIGRIQVLYYFVLRFSQSLYIIVGWNIFQNSFIFCCFWQGFCLLNLWMWYYIYPYLLFVWVQERVLVWFTVTEYLLSTDNRQSRWFLTFKRLSKSHMSSDHTWNWPFILVWCQS